MKLNEWDRAIADLDRAIALGPKNAEAWRNRGYIYEQTHRVDPALRDYREAIRLDPIDQQLKQDIARLSRAVSR